MKNEQLIAFLKKQDPKAELMVYDRNKEVFWDITHLTTEETDTGKEKYIHIEFLSE